MTVVDVVENLPEISGVVDCSVRCAKCLAAGDPETLSDYYTSLVTKELANQDHRNYLGWCADLMLKMRTLRC